MRSISSSETVSAVRIVPLRRLRRRVAGDPLRVLQRPPVREIRRDARRPERVAARRRRQPRRRRPPLDHRQHRPPPERPPAQPPRPVDALEQRRLRVLEAVGVEIRLNRLRGPVVGRHGVPLPALLAQPQPASSPLPEVVLPPHPHRRAHPRETVDHHAQQRPVPQPHHRPRVDPVEERPRLRRRQHRRRALRSRRASGPAPPRPGSRAAPGARPVSCRAPGSPPGAASPSARTPGASGCTQPRGAARSLAAPGRAPRTRPGTDPPPERFHRHRDPDPGDPCRPQLGHQRVVCGMGRDPTLSGCRSRVAVQGLQFRRRGPSGPARATGPAVRRTGRASPA